MLTKHFPHHTKRKLEIGEKIFQQAQCYYYHLNVMTSCHVEAYLSSLFKSGFWH